MSESASIHSHFLLRFRVERATHNHAIHVSFGMLRMNCDRVVDERNMKLAKEAIDTVTPFMDAQSGYSFVDMQTITCTSSATRRQNSWGVSPVAGLVPSLALIGKAGRPLRRRRRSFHDLFISFRPVRIKQLRSCLAWTVWPLTQSISCRTRCLLAAPEAYRNPSPPTHPREHAPTARRNLDFLEYSPGAIVCASALANETTGPDAHAHTYQFRA